MTVKVKICGLTTVEDAEAAVAAGCDFVGLNFVSTSTRYVERQSAKRIATRLSGKTTLVCVFVEPDDSFVREVIKETKPDILQFHSNESNSFCQEFGIPFVKALHVDDNFDFGCQQAHYPNAYGFLLDSASGLAKGGSGETFDWSNWPVDADARLFLAGGLHPNNVTRAVRALRPWAVDVASGVESEAPHKEFDLMRDFVRNAKQA